MFRPFLFCLFDYVNIVVIVTLQWVISTFVFGIGFSLYTAINLYGVLAMENSPPGLSGTAHAIVALAANGKEYFHCLVFTTFIK